MPVQKFIPPPGINTTNTATLSEGGWVASQFVRFFQGFLQKTGGWLQLIAIPLTGTARGMMGWEDFEANGYFIFGTEQLLQVYFNGALYNVTPVAQTDTVTVSFSTTISTKTVTITDTANPAVAGDWIYILNPISVGGIILQGSYQIGTVIDANNFDITAASAAASTATNTGAAALFNTTSTSDVVTVTLDAHGYTAGQVYTVFITTTVGGITLFGEYTVATVVDANNFTITSTAATSTTSGSENGGDVSIQYLLASGAVTSLFTGGLYGEGLYGQGTYGFGTSETFVPARIWSFGYWGTDVIASYRNGGVYTWLSEDGLIDNAATLIATAPLNVNAGIFTAMPQQQAIALGASDGNSSDPDFMLVRFSDVADNTDWTASATNQAGSFRIGRGSQIVGGLQGPQAAMLWTDVGFWVMQYIGFPLVYGFIELGQGCGLIGQNAKGVLSGRVYWMSYNNFFVYDGNSVQVLPCSVWDKIFGNIDTQQYAKVIACPNSFFNEISWCYASSSELPASENDSRVTYNATSNTWTFDPPGSIVRTTWFDQSILSSPLGVDGAGLIQQHEVGTDANGVAMVNYAQSGFIKIANGEEITFLERMIPDAILTNCTLQIWLYFQNYSGQTPVVKGPFTFTQAQNYIVVRGRGRFVSIKIGSSDLGSFWRLGEFLFFGAPAGRSP